MPDCLGEEEDGAVRQYCHDSYAAHFHVYDRLFDGFRF